MDWIGSLLTLVAVYLLADYPKYAVRLFLMSSVLFFIWAVFDEVWSIVALQSVLIVLNIRLVIKWR